MPDYNYKAKCQELTDNLRKLDGWCSHPTAKSLIAELERGVNDIYYLELLHHTTTHKLLDWMNHARATNGRYSPFDDNDRRYSMEEIKEELATREHIPTAKERKEMRRKK